jgi:hypothetical protein
MNGKTFAGETKNGPEPHMQNVVASVRFSVGDVDTLASRPYDHLNALFC